MTESRNISFTAWLKWSPAVIVKGKLSSVSISTMTVSARSSGCSYAKAIWFKLFGAEMTNLSTSSGFCNAEVKLWGLTWGKEPLYPTSKPHLNPDTSFCFWPLSYPSSHASSLDALTGVGSLLGCTRSPFFVWSSSWGWGGVLKGLPLWRIPHVPST